MLIFMEYCEDGTIAQISKIGLPEEIIRVYTLQIVKAVRFVHDNGIVHRDIKGEYAPGYYDRNDIKVIFISYFFLQILSYIFRIVCVPNDVVDN